MSMLPNSVANLTAILILFSLSCNVNAENHTQRNISYTKMMWTNEFESNNEMLANCVAGVLETASNSFGSDIVFSYHSINASMKSILGDLVKRVLQHNFMKTTYFPTAQIVQGYFSLRLCFIDSYDSFINWISKPNFSPVIQNYRKYFVIVLMVPDYSTIAPIIEMQKFFQLFYTRITIDVNIIVATSKEVNIYTFYPYTHGHCGSTRPVLLYSCSEKTGYRIRGTTVFPVKNLNMNLCPLAILAAHLPPFIILEKPYTGEESLTGIDGEILKVISRKLNFSISLNDRSNDISGTVYNNGTSTGIYKLLKQREANLTLGYTECTPNGMRYFVSTKSYYQISLRILLKDSEGYSSLETVFFPFSTQTWIAVLIINILRIILSILKQYQYHNRLHRSIPNMLHIAWCFITLILCASYGSVFFFFLLNQPSKPLPRSFDELWKQNYKILKDVIHGSIAQNIPELKELLIIVNTTPYDVLREFEKSSSNRLGVLTNMETFSYFIRNEFESLGKYVNLDEMVMDSMFCMYFPYISYFTNEFDECIAQMRTFGLSEQIARKFINPIHLPTTKDHRNRQENDTRSSKILSLYHLKGPFIIFLGCQAIAGIVFVLEIISFKFRVLKGGFLIFAK